MNSSNKVLKINPRDNLIVALSDLKKSEIIIIDNQKIELKSNINSKHKFSVQDLTVGDKVYMYGVIVGKAILSQGISLSKHSLQSRLSSPALNIGSVKCERNIM